MSEQAQVRVSIIGDQSIVIPAECVRTEYRAILPDGRAVSPGLLTTLFACDDPEVILEAARKVDPDALLESRSVITLHSDWWPA